MSNSSKSSQSLQNNRYRSIAENSINPEKTRQEAFWDNQALHTSEETIKKYEVIMKDAQENIKRAEASISEIKWKSISEQKESINKVPQMEDTNLHIKSDSSWKEEMRSWVKTITNWKWVWEYIEWEFAGEQIFTQKAAINEAKLQGKILPSLEQWWEIIKSINPNIDPNKWWQNDTSIRNILWLKLAGYRKQNGNFYGQGHFGCFWSSTFGRDIEFDKTRIYPVIDGDPECAFSVRCLKKI